MNPPGALTISAQNETDGSLSITPRPDGGIFEIRVHQTIRMSCNVRLNRSELAAFVAAAQELLDFYK